MSGFLFLSTANWDARTQTVLPLTRFLITVRTPIARQSHLPPIFQFMPSRKTTKKAAAVKRKTVTPKSQNVADLRETLTKAIGALVALDLLIERMMKDKR